MKNTMSARKREVKQISEITYRRRRESVARRASVPINHLLPGELYSGRPTPIRWDYSKDVFSDRRTTTVAVVSYLVAAGALITAAALNR